MLRMENLRDQVGSSYAYQRSVNVEPTLEAKQLQRLMLD